MLRSVFVQDFPGSFQENRCDHVKYDHFVFDQMMSTVCFSLRRCYPYDLCIWIDSCNLSSLFRFQAGYPIFDLLAKILKLLFYSFFKVNLDYKFSVIFVTICM